METWNTGSDPLDENALAARAIAGDRQAMGYLLTRNYAHMYQIALSILRDPVPAEDVTQDSCVQILKQIGQFRGEAPFGAWLSRIVVNTALLRVRRDRYRTPAADLESIPAAAPDPLPERRASDRELLFLTGTFLTLQRDGDTELFARRFLGGETLRSICMDTGLSLAALKSRFHRARARLKSVQESGDWGVALPHAA